MYGLEKSATIKKRSGVIEPGIKSINRNLNRNILKALDFAMKTAK